MDACSLRPHCVCELVLQSCETLELTGSGKVQKRPGMAAF